MKHGEDIARRGERLYWVYYAAVAVICAFLLIIRFVLHPVTVVGDSMSPTFLNGNIVATSVYDPAETRLSYGDVVVFKDADRKRLIKRVVGLPGDTVQVVDGMLFINGVPLPEGFPDMESAGVAKDPYTVPEGAVFVLGDNRNDSTDSRVFGAVPMQDISGVVTRVLIGR